MLTAEMKKKAVTLKEVTPLFITKKGMPYKEKLMTLREICEECSKPLPERTRANASEYQYLQQLALSVLSALKKQFYEHHCFFVAPNIDGIIHYGFTSDMELIDNYCARVHVRMIGYKALEQTVQSLRTQKLLKGNE